MEKLERLAREINPNLPTDLSGYLLHITMSRNGCTAWVSRTHAGRAAGIPRGGKETEPEWLADEMKR